MTQKMIALLLSLLLALNCFGNLALAQQDSAALPEVGAVVEGFKVLQHAPYPMLDATCVLMEHEKTKAKLVYAACSDIDRAFSITFRTFARDDKGIPHVFEHSTLSGNEKYPDPSLFFTMTTNTYHTYLNAATAQTATTFPCASLSEEQLYAFADYVLAGVFRPLIMSDERAMMREAYRYELTGKDEPITLSGTVYSEMQGATTMMSQAFQDLQKTLYPGSTRSNNTGGDPAVIPDMTWQEVKDFHDTYYHPSNALMLLYGDLDLPRFLRMIDTDYLSGYEYREILPDEGPYEPYEGYREASFTFPTAEGDLGQPVVFYAFSLDGADFETCTLLSYAAAALAVEGSPFQNGMRDRLPNAMGDVIVFQDTVEPAMVFAGVNVDAGKKDVFKSIVEKAVADTLVSGLDMGQIEGLCSQQKFNNLAMGEQAGKGIMLSMSMTEAWGQTDDPFGFLLGARFAEKLDAYLEADAFNEAFRACMTAPVRSALTTTVAQPGGLEANAAALAEALAARKAAMSDAEIDALIRRTEDFAQWTQDNAESSMIDRVKVVGVQELPETVTRYEAAAEERDGLKVVTSEMDGGDLVLLSFRLDASAIPFEMLHTYSLLTACMFSMPTANYKLDALMRETSDLLFNPSVSASLREHEDEPSRPELVISWATTHEKLEDSFKLIEEVLFRTDLSQTAYFNQMLSNAVVGAYYAMTGQLEMLALSQAMAALNTDADYLDYVSGMGMYRYLIDNCVELQKPQLSAMLSTIQAVRSLLLNKRGACVTCVGDRAGIDAAAGYAQKLYAMLGDVAYPAADYASKLPKRPRALAVDVGGTVQMNVQAMRFEDAGVEDSGKLMAMKALVQDRVLLPVLRFENSVYGAMSELNDPFIYLLAYRDPSIGRTYAFFREVGERLRGMTLAQEELDGYILSPYSGLATPMGPLSGGSVAVNDALSGTDTFGKIERWMKEIKTFSPDDVARYAAIYDQLAGQGVIVTVGGSQAITADRKLFEAVDKTLVR